VGYCGRRIQERESGQTSRWVFPRGLPKSEILFGSHLIDRAHAPAVVVVESPWSVLRLHQVGLHPAVALLGSHASKAQCRWLREFSSVVVMLDGDEAGRAGAERLCARLTGFNDVLRLDAPDGLDPADLEDESLHSLLRDAASSFLNQPLLSRGSSTRGLVPSVKGGQP